MGVNLWAFVGISVVVIIAPGPDTVMVTKNAIVHGRRAALGTAVGVSTGLLVWTLAAGIGVAALIRASAIAFTAVKLVGAAYLIWLGLQAWRHARARSDLLDAGATRGGSALGGFRQGVASDLGNPKIAIFFTSLLPQFVTSRHSATEALLLLGGVFVALTFMWLAAYAYAAARLADLLVRPRVKAVLDRVTGTVLIAFGVRVALERR
jgi:RhtB (resistance to homoserine/threonine) family protein